MGSLKGLREVNSHGIYKYITLVTSIGKRQAF